MRDAGGALRMDGEQVDSDRRSVKLKGRQKMETGERSEKKKKDDREGEAREEKEEEKQKVG
jgi:hypothetical protein